MHFYWYTFDKCGGISMYTEYYFGGRILVEISGDAFLIEIWMIDSIIERFVDVKLKMKFRNDITVYGYYYDSCGFLGELRFPREELLLERIGKIISRSPRSLLIKRYDVEECSFPCWLLAAEFPSIRIIYETLLQKLKITDGYSGIGMERSSTKSECSMATNSR